MGIDDVWLLVGSAHDDEPAQPSRPVRGGGLQAGGVVRCLLYQEVGAEGCGVSSSEAADLLKGAGAVHEATKKVGESEQEGTPEWKQRCIDLYVNCKDDAWVGSCYECLRYCEGQRDWPLDKCRPRKQGE